MLAVGGISIHALLAESDGNKCRKSSNDSNFYPRSPCGERLWPGLLARPFFLISIHALLAESDLILHMAHLMGHLFLSTLSLRRATALVWCSCGGACDFYPRSPCGERPASHLSKYNTSQNFYPRSPCGERHFDTLSALAPEEFLSTLSLRRATTALHDIFKLLTFLSTLSLRRATRGGVACYLDNIISIHALLAESDLLLAM